MHNLPPVDPVRLTTAPRAGLVLIVEDNSATAGMIAHHLRHHGIDTLTAADGITALTTARACRPDLVLLDANLPDMDGLTVCRVLKDDPALAGMLVAFLSAERTSVRHRVTGLDTGADAYLTHPIDEAELIAQVRSLLRVRKAEDAAIDSRDLYRDLLDAAPIGIAHVALDGIVVTANRTLATFLATSPAEISGRLFDVFLHPDERATMRAVFAEVSGGQREPRSRELRLLTSGGATIWVNLAGRLHRAPDGTPTHIIVALEDITARKKAEAALAERDNLLHELYEASHDLIATVDADGAIIQVNSACSRALGATAAILRGTPLEAYLAPASRQAWHSTLSRVAGGAGDEFFRGTLSSAVQSAIHVEGSLARRDTNEGAAVRVILQDVTERRRLEETLLRNQRIDSLGTLAGGIAHDLNNLLAPILLSLGLIRGATSEAEREEYVDSIEKSAQRATDLVRQVLLFARGAGTEKSALEPSLVLRDLHQMLEETFPKSIELDFACGAETGSLLANATQVSQVLLNLCVNARDAMPEGGRLTVRARRTMLDEVAITGQAGAIAGPYVVFTVTDTGNGIPASAQERIFDPFFTTKGVGEGTGLGLPTALGIVRSHGGFITLHSVEGEGSTFEVHLPACRPCLSEPSPAASSAPPPARRQGELILLIDDERILRETAEKMLRAHGYRVICAADGIEGVARAADLGAEIRAVVTDLMMPRLDGFAAAEAIHRVAPGVPVIAMTGVAGDDLTRRVNASGIRRLVTKPFEPVDLLRVLDEVLSTPRIPGDDAALLSRA